MSMKLYEESDVQNLANIIREKNGTSETYSISQMDDAVSDLNNFSGDYNDLTNKPTLGTASSKDIAASGNASSTQVVMGNDTRLTDRRGSTWGQINGTLMNQTDLKNSIDSLQGQIDIFTALPDGSTAGDAELTNIRVDSTGHTYPTAGDAVRAIDSQVNAMKTGFDGVVYQSPVDMVTSCDENVLNYGKGILDKLLKINLLYSKNNYFINKTNGAEVSYAGFKVTDYMPIFSKIIYMQKPFFDSAGMAFYDSNKEYISGVSGGTGAASITDQLYMVKVPSNAAYFRTTTYNTDLKEFYADISQVDDAINSVYDLIKYDLDFSQSGMINKANGNVAANSGFKCTDYVEIYGKAIKMQMPFYDAAGIAFYDSSKTFISGTGRFTYTESVDNEFYTIPVPSNAAYFRTCKRTTFTNTGFYAICGFVLSRNAIEFANIAKLNTLDRCTYSKIDYIGNGFINRNTGNIAVTDGFSYSDFIKINSHYIGIQKPFYDAAGLAFYDENKTYVSGIAGGADLASVTDDMYLVKVPTGAVYFRTCKNNQKNYNTIYGNFDSNINAICLPDTIYILPGQAIRIYYYQICNTRNSGISWFVTYTGDVQISPTDEYVQLYSATAKTGSVTIKGMDVNKNVICQKTFSVVCSEKSITQKAMFIGDSFTEYAFYLAQLKSLLGNSLTLYGTLSTTAEASDGTDITVNHEGRAGWSANTYIIRSDGNPFYNSGFDFSYYMTNHSSYSDLTDVYIMLGMNGGTAGNMKTICDSIKAYNSDINIHIILQPKVANCSRTYGVNWHQNLSSANESFQKYWQSVYDLLSTYDIIPSFINVNSWYDYTRIQNPVSSRNPETLEIITDVIHPTKYGHYNIADVIMSQIKKDITT